VRLDGSSGPAAGLSTRRRSHNTWRIQQGRSDVVCRGRRNRRCCPSAGRFFGRCGESRRSRVQRAMTAAVNETPSSTTPRQRTSAGWVVGAAIVLFAVIVTMPRDTGPTSLLVLCAATIAIATAGSALPFSPIEPYLLALPAAAPKGWLVPLVLLAIAGHMVGKALLYYASRNAARSIPQRYEGRVEAARRGLLGSQPIQFATIAASSVAGVPPFYVVTVLCGALHVPAAAFLILATIGRAVRFAALVALANIVTG
jgi:membrane protein YqaA with SNARE-associated domain